MASLEGMYSFTNCLSSILPHFHKHLPRTGWVKKGIPHPETVSGHMYRMSMMAFLFGGSSDATVNKERLST